MSKIQSMLLLMSLATIGVAHAQAPTGTIIGVVTDATGAGVAGAHITITNRATGLSRNPDTSAEGDYSAAALPPGDYQVTAEATGFIFLERTATVEAGTTTTVNLQVQVGGITENISVSNVAPLIRYDHHQVGGLVSRQQIENLPLNGRNFLELAKLEPGVQNPARLNDNRVFVSFLGSGLQTVPRVGYSRVTVDGASITTPGTAGVVFQVSQEVVQEFQLSTVNFDVSTSLASNGAINIVTRSGGNDYHGDAFFFYRDHHLAAYPGLRRDASNPHPFFQRQQLGLRMGGPVRRDRAFFFASHERHDQRGVVSIQPTTEFGAVGGIFPSPYLGNQVSTRADVRLNANHNAFARYTHDGNSAFVNAFVANNLPSGWTGQTNQAGQGLLALTSVLSSRIVNDLRFSYFFVNTSAGRAPSEECPGCFGLGSPRITFSDGGLAFGDGGMVSFGGRRYQLTDSLVWQKGNHRLRFGFDWEHATNTFSDQGVTTRITLWSPREVRQLNPAILLPGSFTTPEDILKLPLQSFETTIGSGVVPWRDFGPHRVLDLYRLYVGDTWRVGPRLTVNVGLAWSYEPNALNHDLTKPALLIPILGADGLNAPAVQVDNFSPTLGFAWAATRDGKTVMRGGAGRYFDPAASSHFNNFRNERQQLSPLSTGSVSVPGPSIPWQGGTLEFKSPTTFTGAQLLSILPRLRGELLRTRNPDNRDFAIRNIDFTKSGANLYDPSYRTPYAIHLTLGVQRQLAGGIVLNADVVWKRFIHAFINGIDYNRWNSLAGPVIPACMDEQKNDVAAVCSNGNIYFDTTIGRTRYKGLLVRAEKRFSGRAQFLASYAFGSYVGTNGTGLGTSEASGGRFFGFNNDDWFENYGPLPTDLRHILNLSGFANLPWRLQVAFSVSAYSRPPFAPYVNGLDFNGDGTMSDLLPGTRVNQFNRGLDKGDLVRLVDRYNQEVAGKPLCCNQQPARRLTLPADYAFGDSFFTQDLRLSHTVSLGTERVRLILFGEVFNLLNIANLVGYSGNIANAAQFGQPGARFSQVFGSGGPQAFQFGARVSF